MHSISVIICAVGIMMMFGTAIETRALQHSYLEKRTLPDEFEDKLGGWQKRVANLCLYYCIRIQQRPRDYCYPDCQRRFKVEPDPEFEIQAMADWCYANCMNGREPISEEKNKCLRACGGEWMVQPNDMALSVSERNFVKEEEGTSPALAASPPNTAAKSGSIFSIGKEAGNNVAYDTLRWFGQTMNRLAGGGTKKKNGDGGMQSQSPVPAPVPFSQFGKSRPLFPLAP